MALISTLAKATGIGLGTSVLLGYLGIVQPLKYYGRYTVFVLLVIFSALYGASVSIILTLIGKQGLSQHVTARFFLTVCRIFLGIRFDVRNEDVMLARPAVFISNHQSDLDIDILGRMFPPYCSVTAKKSLKYYPFLGWFMTLSGSVFLNRTDRNSALKAFDEAKVVMRQKKQSVFLFPEGTRSHYTEPGLLPFKKGAFHLAVQAQVPVIPFVVQNYSTIWSHRKKIIETGTITIEVMDPIDTTGMTAADVPALVERVEKQMTETAKRLGYAKKD